MSYCRRTFFESKHAWLERDIGFSVEALVKKGLIDPDRVGATGFLRAGSQVLYAITHPGRTRLAAAIVADSYTGSYGRFLNFPAMGLRLAPLNDYDRSGGAFWENKTGWLEHEPTFNVDRVVTPLQFTTHATGGYSRTSW